MTKKSPKDDEFKYNTITLDNFLIAIKNFTKRFNKILYKIIFIEKTSKKKTKKNLKLRSTIYQIIKTTLKNF